MVFMARSDGEGTASASVRVGTAWLTIPGSTGWLQYGAIGPHLGTMRLSSWSKFWTRTKDDGTVSPPS